MDRRTGLIRDRAYALWLEAGQPEGSHEEHWRQAEAEIDAQGGGQGSDPTADAVGAFAPSQADPANDGLVSAEPRTGSGDGDATRPKDDHSGGS